MSYFFVITMLFWYLIPFSYTILFLYYFLYYPTFVRRMYLWAEQQT